MRRSLLIAAGVLVLLTSRVSALDAQEKRGQTIALIYCARCHAVGWQGASPFEGAPPFRTLHKRYPVTDLAEALAEGITSAHPSMPEFRFDADETDALIAYLKTLER